MPPTFKKKLTILTSHDICFLPHISKSAKSASWTDIMSFISSVDHCVVYTVYIEIYRVIYHVIEAFVIKV